MNNNNKRTSKLIIELWTPPGRMVCIVDYTKANSSTGSTQSINIIRFSSLESIIKNRLIDRRAVDAVVSRSEGSDFQYQHQDHRIFNQRWISAYNVPEGINLLVVVHWALSCLVFVVRWAMLWCFSKCQVCFTSHVWIRLALFKCAWNV